MSTAGRVGSASVGRHVSAAPTPRPRASACTEIISTSLTWSLTCAAAVPTGRPSSSASHSRTPGARAARARTCGPRVRRGRRRSASTRTPRAPPRRRPAGSRRPGDRAAARRRRAHHEGRMAHELQPMRAEVGGRHRRREHPRRAGPGGVVGADALDDVGPRGLRDRSADDAMLANGKSACGSTAVTSSSSSTGASTARPIASEVLRVPVDVVPQQRCRRRLCRLPAVLERRVGHGSLRGLVELDEVAGGSLKNAWPPAPSTAGSRTIFTPGLEACRRAPRRR